MSGTYQHGRVRKVSKTASVKIILHSGMTPCSLVRYGDVSEEMLPSLWMQHFSPQRRHTHTVSDFQDTARLKAGSVRCTVDPLSTSLIK